MRDSLQQPVNRDAWWTRDHVACDRALCRDRDPAGALLAARATLHYSPRLGACAGRRCHPLHGWLTHQIKKPGLAAGIAVFAIAVVLAALVIFVGQSLVSSIASGTQTFQSFFQNGQWREHLARIPWLGSLLASLEQQVNLSGQLQSMAGEVGKRVSEFAAGSAWVFVQILLTFFVLFYLFRDRREALGTLRSLVPLSEKETDKVFTRVADTIHATVFGTLTVAAVQGVLGGLIFWWLGLPAPILWGAVMALLAIVPVLGAFVVWLPVAIFLAASGQWGQAVILTLWGTVVVGLIDNLLYPMLVGKRLRLHTVPVFFAIVGGLAVFGAAGVILGPVILALTDAILEIWRRRTAAGRPAEEASDETGNVSSRAHDLVCSSWSPR